MLIKKAFTWCIPHGSGNSTKLTHSTWKIRKINPFWFNVPSTSMCLIYRKIVTEEWYLKTDLSNPSLVPVKGFLQILTQISNRQIKLQAFDFGDFNLFLKHVHILWSYHILNHYRKLVSLRLACRLIVKKLP